MRRRISRIIGIGVALVLFTSLFMITVPASALTQAMVKIAAGEDVIKQENPDYIIIFALGKELEAGDTITITFPEDTTIAAPTATISASQGWIGGMWQNAVVTNVSWAGNAILRTITATLGAGDQIGEVASVRIGITAGITNPSNPGDYTLTVSNPGDYTLTVKTSDETTPVTSTIYTITTPMMVPTMTLWGGIAMTVVLGLLVVYMVRRRQTAPTS